MTAEMTCKTKTISEELSSAFHATRLTVLKKSIGRTGSSSICCMKAANTSGLKISLMPDMHSEMAKVRDAISSKSRYQLFRQMT